MLVFGLIYGNWKWNFVWNESHLTSQTVEEIELLMLLADISPVLDISDNKRWIPEQSRLFSMQSTYKFLLNRVDYNVIDGNVVNVLINFGQMMFLP
ncbi:hypothetical protein QL285_076427 [Trifolium repens]|jgi:hypothetical protein|nr:hypothetical protein QL285_076427 [Trifolium repens]